MRIALFVNDVSTESELYTSTLLAWTALRRGHEVWYLGVEDFAYGPDEQTRAHARTAPPGDYETPAAWLAALQGDGAREERMVVEELDVLLLRNNPADDEDRPWAQSVGLLFGREARRRGVIVLNDPDGLSRASSKLYFQAFPEVLRPRTLITRHLDEVRELVDEVGKVVLKPLTGSGGRNVFLLREEDRANFTQICDAVREHGYIIAQEYLPAAAEGDTRLLLMNGRPLEVDGRYAAIRRVSRTSDVRSNYAAGGEVVEAQVTDAMLELAALARPRLVADGMFLVGLDIAGDKLMEVNVFSPGGLTGASRFEGVDFAGAVIASLEEKVDAVRRSPVALSNRVVATL